MDRTGAFCASLLGVGVAALGAGLLMAFGLLPDPAAGRLTHPLAGVLAVVGILYAVVAVWLALVRPKREAAPDLLVGYVLFHVPRPALLLASAEGLLFFGAWGALVVGVRPLSATDWTVLMGLSAASLFLVVMGALALAYSRGRGSAGRKSSASRALAAAVVLAMVPWAARAAFPW